jgi:GH18 family chitinase
MGSGAPMNCRLNGDKCDGTPDAPPSAPTNLRSPAASYDVYAGSTLATNVTGTTATVAGLAPSTAYSFTVRARDNYDNLSGPSNAVSVTTDDVIGGGNYARVGYFVQWGIYGRQYFVRNLDTSGAAEADYSRPFAATQSVDGVADTGWENLRGNYNQLKKLKAKHAHLKVLISIGGWTYSQFFSDAALTAASREKFVRSCIDMDGIDLDWEWPGAEGHAGNHVRPSDKANNTLTATTGKRYLLTAFTPADPAKIAAGWDITTQDGNPSVFGYKDFANVQGYDFHGAGSDNSWEPNRTGHAGNLVATFPNLPIYHDEQAVATYGYTGPGCQWWTFDDAWSIQKKTAWLKSKGLLGAMIWEMSGDNGPLMTPGPDDRGMRENGRDERERDPQRPGCPLRLAGAGPALGARVQGGAGAEALARRAPRPA